MKPPVTVIACQMLRDEINHVFAKHGLSFSVVWLESTLHDVPEKLHQKVKEEVSRITGGGDILLAMTLCGNALLGIGSRTSRLVLPKFDDCINMFLAPDKIETGSYYHTLSWLASPEALHKQKDKYVEQYGAENAEAIMETLLAHYRNFVLLDTGVHELLDYIDDGQSAASKLGLEFKTVKGNTAVLEGLITGEWNEDFYIIEPGKCLTMNDVKRTVPG